MNSAAILARTNLALMQIEQALMAEGVPFHRLKGSGFWSQPELKSVLSYLGCINYPADWLLAGAVRAPFFPSRYLPKTSLLKELKEQSSKDRRYWKLLVESPQTLVPAKNISSLREFSSFLHSLSRYKGLPSEDALKSVIQVLKVVEYYKEEEAVDNDPIANLIELTKLASRHPNLKDFLDYCRRASAASKGKRGVAVGTVHSAKGLEWHSVYLIGCSEGLMPHSKATDLQEESAIFFVACSRAERELKITYTGNPSPFISGIIEANKESK